MLTRRHVLASALAAPAILRLGTGTAHAATTLKISHQFPGGTIDKGDFRDRLCRMFAAELAKRSGGDMTADLSSAAGTAQLMGKGSTQRRNDGGTVEFSKAPEPQPTQKAARKSKKSAPPPVNVPGYEIMGVLGRGGSIDGPGPTVANGVVYVNSGYPTAGGTPGNVLLAFSVDGK